MTQVEIIEALAEGKKLRGKYWEKEWYIHLVDGRLVNEKGELESKVDILDNHNLFELYEQPKKKVKLYKYAAVYVFMDGRKSWIELEQYFKDDADFLSRVNTESYKKLEHTMIEVEE